MAIEQIKILGAILELSAKLLPDWVSIYYLYCAYNDFGTYLPKIELGSKNR